LTACGFANRGVCRQSLLERILNFQQDKLYKHIEDLFSPCPTLNIEADHTQRSEEASWER